MKKKIAYIAGRVSGLPYEEVKEKFAEAERQLEAIGYDVVNPIDLVEFTNAVRAAEGEPPFTDATHRKEIMGLCIGALSICDELHLLPDYKWSNGALQEKMFAEHNKMPIIYHD